mmetsp:Transcript_33745/g.86530  ORF Transcript_33745/g.86530 Transcript_33745/m.86530 type:complete len:229 (-) Transcript_33745:140-826(-)
MSAVAMLVALLASLLVCTMSTVSGMGLQPFKVGDVVPMECKQGADAKWGPPPTCIETGEPFAITFGLERFLHCSISLDETQFEYVKSVVENKESWQCRIAVTADRQLYMPISFPLWGVVDGPHVHVDNRLHFIFHADNGKIVGGAIYPMRDKYEGVKKGGKLSLHGPLKWFSKESYQTIGTDEPVDVQHDLPVSLVAAAVFAFTLLLSSLLYFAVLKPNLAKTLLKSD